MTDDTRAAPTPEASREYDGECSLHMDKPVASCRVCYPPEASAPEPDPSRPAFGPNADPCPHCGNALRLHPIRWDTKRFGALTCAGVAEPGEAFDDLLNRYGIACCDHGAAAIDSDACEEAMCRRRDLWQRLRATVAALTAERTRDSARLDWLGTPRADTDVVICSPGEHGGAITNWLLTLEHQRVSSQEWEAPTLREAIDLAARAAPRGDNA